MTAQSDRAAQIRAEIMAESAERERQSRLDSGFLVTARRPILNRAQAKQISDDDIERLCLDRDPCGLCGVRKDRHDAFGCARWRVL